MQTSEGHGVDWSRVCVCVCVCVSDGEASLETGGAVLDHVSRDAGVLVHKSDVVDSGHVCVCV